MKTSLGAPACLVLLLLGQVPCQAKSDDAEVASAIARGVAFLKEQQEPDGRWSYSQVHDLGMTALAGLALLENGCEPHDPSIGRASEFVATQARNWSQTYDLALAILYLARVQRSQNGSHDDLIRHLAERLAAAGNGGAWGYNVPESPSETDDDRGRSRGGRRLFGGSRRFREPWDNSNTQFALLGVWAAGRHGFASSSALGEIDQHFRETVLPGGQWGYQEGDRGRNAMTCAGLMGLAVAAARPDLAERQTARARGVRLAADPVFQEALRAVGEDARQIGRSSDVYYLWSLERVCVALGLRDLDGFDWYAAGSEELLRRQDEDGGWPAERWGRLPATALSLLFLRKANLAFELERVLKLPGKSAGATVQLAAFQESDSNPPEAPKTPDATGPEVVVTGASDANFPEISVDFEVKAPDGSFLLEAEREDFKVFEDGQPVEIQKFLSPYGEAQPITVVLVVDRSRSMEEEDRIGSLKQAVGIFLKGLPKGSRVAVVAFGSEVREICPFTDDLGRVQATVDRLTPGGATRYYDAVAESLDLIAKVRGRRAVLALTDGEDTFSQNATLDTVIASARRLGLPVHTLGLGSEDEIESEALKELASSTRGQYYPAREAEQLSNVYRQLAERLRSSYTLVYRSERKIPDGTLRPVRVAYRASSRAGETAVFIPGMVVPAPGWSRLYLALVGGLGALFLWPSIAARRGRSGQTSS